MTESRWLSVPEGLAGERVDAGLARMFGISRTAAAELAAAGGVRLADRMVGKSDRLIAGALLEVDLPDPAKAAPREPEPVAGLTIAYDDEDLVVVDKPVGVAAHPSVGWSGPTVTGSLAAAGYRISTSGAAERQGVVSRLDVGTSGLMVVAKSELAYSKLKRAFRSRSVRKTYHAVVQGLPDPSEGTIDAPIGRRPGAEFKFAVREGGKESITHYKVLEAFPRATLVEVHLETGRTHQIRVHFAAIHHPCLGDLMYGADPSLAERTGLTRQWLHAMELGFEHPRTGEWFEVTSTYPADLEHALEVLRS